MESISDVMKEHINHLSSIKTKLIKEGIWSAESIANKLKSINEINSIKIANNKDKLYVNLKNCDEITTNKLDCNICENLSMKTHEVLNKNKKKIDNILNEEEKEYYKHLGTKKISTMMCHISPLPMNNLVIMNI